MALPFQTFEPNESTPLRVVPSERDHTGNAYEPNETPQLRVVVSRERNHTGNGAPFGVCSSKDIPVFMFSDSMDLQNTVLLSPSKDAIVPSGSSFGLNSVHVSYGQKLLKFET